MLLILQILFVAINASMHLIAATVAAAHCCQQGDSADFCMERAKT